MCSVIEYLNTKHDYVPFPGQIKVQWNEKDLIKPDEPEEFKRRQEEYARKLVSQTKHIQALVDLIPSSDRSELKQMQEIRGLEEELVLQNKELQVLADEQSHLKQEMEVLVARTASIVKASRLV